MSDYLASKSRSRRHVPWAEIGRLILLLIPTCVLVGASLRYAHLSNTMLWLGTSFQLVVCFLSFFSRSSWRQPLGPSVITLYLIALCWLWFGDTMQDWYSHFAKAVLLIIPLCVFGFQTLAESGAPAMRRANLLAQRLAERKEWPSDLNACRILPEVKALRAALGSEASPALVLLQHDRIEVRVAALAALEFRKDWKPGQAEMVLTLAQRAEQPALRAAAVTALGNIDDRMLVEALSQFLHDTSLEVRKAAMEALLWDTENRWPWIRYSVRRILADPLFLNDGPLTPDGQLLNHEAVNDLTAWCAEKGCIASRSALTLGAHYNRSLSERADPKLLQSLRTQLASSQTPAVLRLELGRLLQFFQELDAPLLDRLLDSSNPASLRMIACETILSDVEDESIRIRATTTLRELARLPNREIALATADVIQRRLGVDMGLGLGQPLPVVQSRQAAEIARRVMHWATQYDQEEEELEDSHLMR